MKINDDANLIKKEIGNWVSSHTETIPVDKGTIEIATTEIDAYGDTIYCFVEKEKQTYRISDDGHILFKLDPGETDRELYSTAEEIAIGAGFDFDEKTCTISVTTTKDNIAQAVIKLAQLQLAISYLG